jgi:hypothetical protein
MPIASVFWGGASGEGRPVAGRASWESDLGDSGAGAQI